MAFPPSTAHARLALTKLSIVFTKLLLKSFPLDSTLGGQCSYN